MGNCLPASAMTKLFSATRGWYMRRLVVLACFLGVFAVVVAVTGCGGDAKNADPAVQPQKDKDTPNVKPHPRPKPVVEGN
jgi:hypothetical protein